MECEYCLRTGDDVRETYDPYELEIRGELKAVIACDGCLQMLADDV